MMLSDGTVERFALRVALGSRRKEWPPHYPDDRKEYWRRFVRDLATELAVARSEDDHAEKRT